MTVKKKARPTVQRQRSIGQENNTVKELKINIMGPNDDESDGAEHRRITDQGTGAYVHTDSNREGD
ncbi:MAG: hypothetical protein KA408_05790 [Flavobacteriales bacterium]|nr:hypothetical protein [Flavobacteriales bacterium]